MPCASKVNAGYKLRTVRLPCGCRQLCAPLKVTVAGVSICIPSRFVTDFSSIPLGFIKWSKVDIAGVVHDWLYSMSVDGFDRCRADDVWCQLAGSGRHHANPLQRLFGWWGLRLFGCCRYDPRDPREPGTYKCRVTGETHLIPAPADAEPASKGAADGRKTDNRKSQDGPAGSR